MAAGTTDFAAMIRSGTSRGELEMRWPVYDTYEKVVTTEEATSLFSLSMFPERGTELYNSSHVKWVPGHLPSEWTKRQQPVAYTTEHGFYIVKVATTARAVPEEVNTPVVVVWQNVSNALWVVAVYHWTASRNTFVQVAGWGFWGNTHKFVDVAVSKSPTKIAVVVQDDPDANVRPAMNTDSSIFVVSQGGGDDSAYAARKVEFRRNTESGSDPVSGPLIGGKSTHAVFGSGDRLHVYTHRRPDSYRGPTLPQVPYVFVETVKLEAPSVTTSQEPNTTLVGTYEVITVIPGPSTREFGYWGPFNVEIAVDESSGDALIVEYKYEEESSSVRLETKRLIGGLDTSGKGEGYTQTHGEDSRRPGSQNLEFYGTKETRVHTPFYPLRPSVIFGARDEVFLPARSRDGLHLAICIQRIDPTAARVAWDVTDATRGTTYTIKLEHSRVKYHTVIVQNEAQRKVFVVDDSGRQLDVQIAEPARLEWNR